MKVVRLSALRTGLLYHSGFTPDVCFFSRLSRHQGYSVVDRIKSMKNPNETIDNRSCDIPLGAQGLIQLRHRVPHILVY
jgi:hypothetical protein